MRGKNEPDRRRGNTGALACVVVLATAAADRGVGAGALYEQEWIEARSPNFIVASALNEKNTREVVRELEDFRQLVGVFTNARELDPRVPTMLLIFPGPVREIGLVDPIAGFFHPGMRANYAVARRVPGEPTSYFMQHEYTHFIVRNQSRQAYPRWFDEGFAELLATADVRNGKFEFGKGAEGRMYQLAAGPLMKGSRLVDDEQTNNLTRLEGDEFYAQAWGLVHYLTWGRPGVDFSQQLRTYLAARETGTPAVPAFEQSFGENVDKINGDVQAYLSRKARYFKGELKHPFEGNRVSTRRMAPDEVAAAIGHLCIEIGQIDKARPYVDAALQFNPNNARALVDKGDLYKHDKNYEAARARYEKAIALEPKNDWHHLDFGEYWLTVAGTQEDPDQRRYMLLQARQELFVADKLNEKNPETLAIYGESFLWKGEDPAKGIDTLELAHQLLPSNANIKFMLARAYVAVGRRDDARRLLNAMRAWSHEGGAEAAEKLLQEIDKRTADEPPAKGPRNQPTAPAQ